VEQLRDAVRAYAARHANRDGLAQTPVPGLAMKCVTAPRGILHAIARPMVILVLQGRKQLVVGREERIVGAGQSAIVSADLPMVTRILDATRRAPYLALAIELEAPLLREVAAQLDCVAPAQPASHETLFIEDADAALLDCATRLVRLIDRPQAIPLLRAGIMRELYFWLLSSPHGAELRRLSDPQSHASRLAAAINLLQAEFRGRIPTDRLAAVANMSLTVFHRHFKRLTSLTPGQYQKRLRLIEARRLMVHDGMSASSAAFDVGYESVPQFTREYRRLYQVPPMRDALHARSTSRFAASADESVQLRNNL
jgi:AraC-like DNA-binding protein